MIECGILLIGITIGGGRLVFKANASTSIDQELLIASGVCQSCPKWPCHLSSAAMTTAGGYSREDGLPAHQPSSLRKLRSTSVESRNDFHGLPVKVIFPGDFCLYFYYAGVNIILYFKKKCRYHLQRPPDNRLNCSVNPSDEEYQRQVLLATNYWTWWCDRKKKYYLDRRTKSSSMLVLPVAAFISRVSKKPKNLANEIIVGQQKTRRRNLKNIFI